jgi:hypothetical protein
MKMSDKANTLVDSVLAVLHGVRKELSSDYITVNADKNDKSRINMLIQAKLSQKVEGK